MNARFFSLPEIHLLSCGCCLSPGISLGQFLRTELTRGYQLEHDEERYSARREKIYSFMKIPRELEKFMAYGFFQVSLPPFASVSLHCRTSHLNFLCYFVAVRRFFSVRLHFLTSKICHGSLGRDHTAVNEVLEVSNMTTVRYFIFKSSN